MVHLLLKFSVLVARPRSIAAELFDTIPILMTDLVFITINLSLHHAKRGLKYTNKIFYQNKIEIITYEDLCWIIEYTSM